MFSGHVEILILKFSPASATKVRFPGRKGGKGKEWEWKGGGREGKGGEGEGEGEEGRGRRDGVFLPPPTSKYVAL